MSTALSAVALPSVPAAIVLNTLARTISADGSAVLANV
jgi:hypothetical protein